MAYGPKYGIRYAPSLIGENENGPYLDQRLWRVEYKGKELLRVRPVIGENGLRSQMDV